LSRWRPSMMKGRSQVNEGFSWLPQLLTKRLATLKETRPRRGKRCHRHCWRLPKLCRWFRLTHGWLRCVAIRCWSRQERRSWSLSWLVSPLLDGLSENEKPRGHPDFVRMRPHWRGYPGAVNGRLHLVTAAGRGGLLGWRSLVEVWVLGG
jgi:hypothetical protein